MLVAMAAVAAMASSAAACGGGDSGSDKGSGGAAADSGQKKAKVAIVVRNFTNPFWVAVRDGAEDAAKKYGVEVSVQGGANETDAAGQNSKISAMANQDYTCFSVASVNSSNVITPLLPVSRKNIPIISLDTPLDQAEVDSAGLKVTSLIGSNNKKVGQAAGDYLVEQLGGKGKVALIQGSQGAIPGQEREAGFRAAVEGKLDIVQAAPADYERVKAVTVAEAMLKVHPDIQGIYAVNDPMAAGAVQAAKNAGKLDQIKILGNDGNAESLQLVEEGQQAGTVAQSPWGMGYMSVEACVALAQGKQIPPVIESPIRMITKADAAEARKTFPRPHYEFVDPLASMLGGK
jgi:ABC-type sugar transport system substrate-binding protein